jgi:hypothetical protein
MIFGICGFKSSGKDTIADYLVSRYGFKKLSFACALKDILSIIFGWPRDKLEGITKEDRLWRENVDTWWATELSMPHLTPRLALQHFGTEIFRNNWHPDIWTKIIENQLTKYDKIIITDCRFPNEINLVKKYGGKLIHVHKELPDWFHNYKFGLTVDIQNMHISEVSWIRSDFDYVIDNNSTICDLHKKMQTILEL